MNYDETYAYVKPIDLSDPAKAELVRRMLMDALMENRSLEESLGELGKENLRMLCENQVEWHEVAKGDLPNEKYFGDDTGEEIYCKVSFISESPWGTIDSEYHCDECIDYAIYNNDDIDSNGQVKGSGGTQVLAWCILPTTQIGDDDAD